MAEPQHDTKERVLAEQARSWRGKLTLKDIGAPDLVKTLTDQEYTAAGRKYVLGYLSGKASGFIKRTMPKDNQEFEGLAGSFWIMPADPQREELESGLLFIPDAFHNLIGDALRKAKSTDENASVEFAFEVSSIKANNPAGYSWDFKPAIPFQGTHVLSDTMSKVRKIAADRQKLLAAPGKHK
jgi:hypothetical protein